MYNYRILIQYDGGRFDGWQRLGKDASENTVEFKIKEILKKMTGEEAELFCGCRTEKGKTICVMVHKDSLPKELKKKLGIQ